MGQLHGGGCVKDDDRASGSFPRPGEYLAPSHPGSHPPLGKDIPSHQGWTADVVVSLASLKMLCPACNGKHSAPYNVHPGLRCWHV